MLVLARNHKGVLRARRPNAVVAGDPWDSIEAADPNRFRFLQQVASAVDLAQRRFYDIAVQRLVLGISSRSRFREPLQFDGEVHLVRRRSLALSILEFMMTRHDDVLTKCVLDVYRQLETHVLNCLAGLKLTAAVRGKFCDAASTCKYGDLFQSLKTTEETRLTRTIHQAKGGEAAAVFVVLDDGSIDHILNPTAGEEEHRITYVAISRAMDELFIFCPDGGRLLEFQALGATTFVAGIAPETKPPRKRAQRAGD
jgi:DNA helicase-2/ATP-dependent DNA helicase PcrA